MCACLIIPDMVNAHIVQVGHVLSFYRIQPDVSFEALRQQTTRLKQKDKLEGEDGSKRLKPQLPSSSHTTSSHTSPAGKKGPSEQLNREERADEGGGGGGGGRGGGGGGGRGGGGGVGGDGREEGEQSVGRGREGAPISAPAWKLMAKELAR